MAVTKKDLIKLGFTNSNGELIKYMTPEHLLIINGNTMFSAKVGGEPTDDKVLCLIDNFTLKQFCDYMSKTINGYVKKYSKRSNESR